MKVLNRRTATFSALALMLGVTLGGLGINNLICTIAIPVAAFVAGIVFLLIKRPYVFVFYLCFALGAAAFAIDVNIFRPSDGGEYTVEARIEKEGSGLYYADGVSFDGKKAHGKIIIRTKEELEIGDIVRFDGEVARLSCDFFDFYSASRFCDRVYYEVSADGIVTVGSKKTFSEKVKERMAEPMYKFIEPRDAGIIKSLLFGDKSDMYYFDSAAFTAAGLSHLFALSGLHVGFLAGVIAFVCRKAKLNKKLSLGIAAAVLVFYGILTGFPSGLKRATVVTLCMLIAPICRSKNDPLNTLGLASFLIILTNPRELFDLSFIMSVSAVFGIVCFFRPLSSLLAGKSKGLRKYLADSVAVCVSANIFLFPVMANVFNRIAVYAVLANLIILPIAEVAFVLAAVTAILSLIFSGFGVLYYIVQFPIIAVRVISYGVSLLPFSTIGLVGLGVSTVFYLLSFIILSRFVKLESTQKTVLVCSLSAAGCLIFALV